MKTNFRAASTTRGSARRRAGAALVLGLVGAGAVALPHGSSAATPESVTLQNTDAAVSRSGAWTTVTSALDNGGSSSQLNASGFAEARFTGTGVNYLARTFDYAGLADVYLDGVKKTTVDLYSATTRYKQVVYSARGLSDSAHTIRVAYTGRRSAASAGGRINVDAFTTDVTAPAAPAGVRATVRGADVLVTWTPSPDRDTSFYRIYRRANGSTTDDHLGSVDQRTGTFVDTAPGVLGSATYRVVAVDLDRNPSAQSAAAGVGPAAAPSYRRYADCPSATTTVSTGAELRSALSAAGPGTVIRLASGVYTGRFTVTASGSTSAPLWICGPRSATLDGGGVGKGGGVQITGANDVVLAGMTIRNTQKGIFVNGSRRVTVADTRVEDIGDEAIHLRVGTTDSVVVGNSINGTGRLTKAYGEGVYIGNSAANWCAMNFCKVDASSRNTVAYNSIRNTTAEQIEAKEGALDGFIVGNDLDGSGMSSGASDSLIAIQSSGWTVWDNVGVDSPQDGAQVWEYFWAATDGHWGERNVFFHNRFGGSIPGYAVRLAYHTLGNVVACDVTAPSGSQGVSNKTCQ